MGESELSVRRNQRVDRHCGIITKVMGIHSMVSIRYVGMSSAVSGWERMQQDLTMRSGGIYKSFVDSLATLYPAVLESCRVFTFRQAISAPLQAYENGSISNLVWPIDWSHTDLREQILIALFDRRTLLNRQPGGWCSSYLPSVEDCTRFQRLQTSVFRTLEDTDHIRSASDEMVAGIQTWIAKVKRFAHKHPKELGTDLYPITDIHETAYTRQAVPMNVKGHVLLGMSGDAVPLSGILVPIPFWRQRARTVQILGDDLSRLMAFEKDQ
ncbi:uncharacterized protein PAC_11584 [Phialocephala subalpina]|uniref:Uncharacterized protein n=1 Tax=Phialocephala subalpina TaxID=576137 RepID=A0A1L7X9N5_9HELO|nr:uncharacterized protein PAC_11584 [Phialocephala subalpina]